jgi:hypothetical protein
LTCAPTARDRHLRAQLENAAHTGHRCDRLKLDVHRVEYSVALRNGRMNPNVPFLKILPITNDDLGERIPYVAMGLAEN